MACCDAQRFTLDPLVRACFEESNSSLGAWLRALHGIVSTKPLHLPPWTDVALRDLSYVRNIAETPPGTFQCFASASVCKPRRPDVAFVVPSCDGATLERKTCEGAGAPSAVVHGTTTPTTGTKPAEKHSGDRVPTLSCAPQQQKSVCISFLGLGPHREAGSVVVPSGGDHIQVVVTAEMLQALLEEAPWAEHAERLLYLSGLLPRVQLLRGASITLHGFDDEEVKQWSKALGRLSSSYESLQRRKAGGCFTVGEVRAIVAKSVPGVEHALFNPCNVGRWSFGTFQFRSEHLAMLA